MGEHSVSQFADPAQKRQYTKLLLRDIQALERMLREGMFETGIQRIGAEQELVLLDQNWRPATNNMDILESISDPHYTTEIARFNLEINSDPIEFSGKSLSELEQQLADLKQQLAALREAAQTVVDSQMNARMTQSTHWKDVTVDALAALLQGEKG